MTRRRHAHAWVVTVGTRMYLFRGKDEAHALELLKSRYQLTVRPDDVRIRLAGPADVDLADLVGGERDELARWTAAALRKGATV